MNEIFFVEKLKRLARKKEVKRNIVCEKEGVTS
jgi:hypothetical protein